MCTPPLTHVVSCPPRCPLPACHAVCVCGCVCAVLGVVITQSAESREGGSAPSPAGPGLFGSGVQLNVVLGVAALLASATLSGYSTVYLETMLKAADPDSDVNPIWTRNVQLSLCSVVFCVLNLASDGREWEAVMQGRAFDGFLPVVWVAVANMSIGGILVAAVRRTLPLPLCSVFHVCVRSHCGMWTRWARRLPQRCLSSCPVWHPLSSSSSSPPSPSCLASPSSSAPSGCTLHRWPPSLT